MRILNYIFRVASTTPSDDCVPDKYSTLLKNLERDIEITDAGQGDSVNIGATTPSAANRGKPWIRRDRNGAPFGLWQFFRNAWVNMGFTVGDQIWYHGEPGDIAEPWFLADGNNNTLNRSADFDVANKLYIKEFRGFS